ncbi:TetR/AcrR family transcriptional regulator [Spirosoma agri]|uniref:TetR/AcrR family transcriptional regulator n=1 Tax=Spirosoma agri TaxID=1987381 RepID=A0A6M0IGL0_9BACT|nr:TetR/AcrR family transcriptional regulator [Spirosoma agri]NEU67409.1 TetR/AcrR family transcriptional regulator [Spirosoma agri]
MVKQVRNRARTTQEIINALEQLLIEGGIEGVGINQVAQKANVSKVLVYRYFGSMDGLLDHYIRMGLLYPNYTPAQLEQIRPAQPTDLATTWSNQSIQLFRQFRQSRANRQLLKAALNDDPLSDIVSKAQDEELTRLVDQLTFVKGCDYKALSAVVLGGLSFLMVQAQNERPMIGIDLRSNEGWQRVEDAVKIICKAMSQFSIDSPGVQTDTGHTNSRVSNW